MPETKYLDSVIEWIIAQLELNVDDGEHEDVAARVAVLRATFHQNDDSRLLGLALSSTEMAVLLTLTVAELDPRASRLLDRHAPNAPLVALKRFVYGDRVSPEAYRELGRNGRLRRLGLIVPDAVSGQLKVSNRIVGIVLGDGLSTPRLEWSLTCTPSQREQCDLAVGPHVIAEITRAIASPNAVVTVTGMPGVGRRTCLSASARAAGLGLLEVDARRFSTDPATHCLQLQAIALECRLLGWIPLIANLDALVDEKGERLALVGSELAPLIDGPILVTCGVQRPRVDWGRPTILVEMGQPTSAQRTQLWHTALGQGTIEDAQLLAGQYPLAPALIVRAAEAARAHAGPRSLQPEDIFAGIRAVLDDKLGHYARRVTVTQTWEDLVLPQDQVDAIIELMARVRERRTVYETWGFAAKVGRGLGVSALFSGPPGTGKTMVAALIARDLGLELYQVDMSKVVSKFIGETEKNLGALFDAAEAGHAILLFDEADALFGKRTDVKSSNDRYANLETNYLLQRLESFTGICLLTSNHESHIDPAFQRRLSLHLRFDLPEADERAQLWRATLPTAAPVAPNVDFSALGHRYAMSGGYIRNAALRAAFLAANEGASITAAHLERSARVEYEGMGKIAS